MLGFSDMKVVRATMTGFICVRVGVNVEQLCGIKSVIVTFYAKY